MKHFLLFVVFIVVIIMPLTRCQQHPTSATITDTGGQLFDKYCVRCHTATGIGGPTPDSGPVPGEGVQAKDIQLSTKNEQELVAFISNGWGKMPEFADSMSTTDIQLLAHYVATRIERHPGNSTSTKPAQ